MKVLALTSEAITAGDLREALGGDESHGVGRVEVKVVAPAYHESPLQLWLSDADEAIARAERVRRGAAASLAQAGVPVVGTERGDSDPETAIEDALRTFAADRLVVFAHPGSEQRHHEDMDARALEERFGIPVTRVEVAPRATGAGTEAASQ